MPEYQEHKQAAAPITPMPENLYMLATVRMSAQRSRQHTFGLDATSPLPTELPLVMQRGDEVATVQRMLTDLQTSTVILAGDPGAGKSLLAALLYRRFQLSAQAGLPAPKHFAWLRLGDHTTLPDVIAAILGAIGVYVPGIFFQSSEQQIATLFSALRRPQEPALVVLDQCEKLFYPENSADAQARGALPLFQQMLRQELGTSRVLLTCYRSSFDQQETGVSRVRSFLLSRISLPEGTAYLQQSGVKGSYEALSLVWQRCNGHIFSLVLFSALSRLSGYALSYLLDAPDYQPLWSGEVALNLLSAVYHFLSPAQHALMQMLALFTEPVPARGLYTALIGEDTTANLSLFEQELARLVNLSLLQIIVNNEGEACYILPSLWRDYVLEHYLEGSQRNSGGASLGVSSPLSPASNSNEARDIAIAAGHMRIAAYYRRQAQEECALQSERTGPQDMQPTLSTIRHLALGWQWQQAWDMLLSENVYERMVQWGAWSTLISLYLNILPPNGVVTRRDEGLICNHLGLVFDRLGNQRQSYAYYDRALAVQRQVRDHHGAAMTLTNQGELLRSQGQLQLAHANFEQARALNATLHDSLLESVLLQNLGLLHHAVKDYPRALHFYQEALRFAQSLEEPYNKGMILTNIGVLWYEQGYYPESLALLQAVLQDRRSLQFATVDYIESFLDTLEQRLGPEGFARLRQAARAVKKDVLARLQLA
jgi:tetratricopeptide (TPR) repeat protein